MNDILGRSICGDQARSSDTEWLVTNGIGGFSSGTVSGMNTRRYHGFLIAALAPPVGRTLLVAKLDISVKYLGNEYQLACNEFSDGTVAPHGYQYLESFYLDSGLPVWRFALADALIEQRIVMKEGENTSYLQLKVVRASAAVDISIRPLCSYRDYHSHSQGGWSPLVRDVDGGIQIDAFYEAQEYFLYCPKSEFTHDFQWLWHFKQRVEAFRGLDSEEDLFSPGIFNAQLKNGDELTLVAATSKQNALSSFQDVISSHHQNQQILRDALPQNSPDWIQQLALASDQFIVDRYHDGKPVGKTVIAGYPWFSDWGRDTMISLSGLTLSLKRYDIAASIIRTFAMHLSEGMLPNRFPDNSDDEPEYNTVDATLWYFNTIGQYLKQSNDQVLAEELFPSLVEIIDYHSKGTRFGIQVDENDGLLRAGEAGIQLTWMDAKVGDWVVTPRMGKPVEINALWYNALCSLVEIGKSINQDTQSWQKQAQRVKSSFSRFWNEERNCLFDVIDITDGVNDPSIRPNQIFAVSLPFSPLSISQATSIVDVCGRNLFTSYGLRSLAPSDANYIGTYGGGPLERDGAYHQGTVWSWLLGPFVEAFYRVYKNKTQALELLKPMGLHLSEACLGTVSEIFDGDAPHNARGCFAQAWGVSETLRVWIAISEDE